MKFREELRINAIGRIPRFCSQFNRTAGLSVYDGLLRVLLGREVSVRVGHLPSEIKGTQSPLRME